MLATISHFYLELYFVNDYVKSKFNWELEPKIFLGILYNYENRIQEILTLEGYLINSIK